MPPCCVSELQEAFNLFDKNQDGIICRQDLQACLTMLGHPEPNDHIVDKVIRNAGNRRESNICILMLFQGRGNRGDGGTCPPPTFDQPQKRSNQKGQVKKR